MRHDINLEEFSLIQKERIFQRIISEFRNPSDLLMGNAKNSMVNGHYTETSIIDSVEIDNNSYQVTWILQINQHDQLI